jgi:hypothetical protein
MIDRTRFDWITEAEAKTDAALALVKRMVDWFFATYEEHSAEDDFTYDGRSDDWDFERNTGCSAREGLDGAFSAELTTFDDTERTEIIDAAVDDIEQGGCRVWAEKPAPANVRCFAPMIIFGDADIRTDLKPTSARPRAGESSRLVPAISIVEPQTPSPARRA